MFPNGGAAWATPGTVTPTISAAIIDTDRTRMIIPPLKPARTARAVWATLHLGRCACAHIVERCAAHRQDHLRSSAAGQGLAGSAGWQGMPEPAGQYSDRQRAQIRKARDLACQPPPPARVRAGLASR